MIIESLKTWEFSSAGRASALQAEGHRFEPCNSHFFMSKNKKETKQGSEAQQERVMHERARGHEVERGHSHFLCLKTKKKQNKGERRSREESCTNVQEDTRSSAVTLIFYV